MSVQNDPMTARKRIATWWMKWEDLRWPNADNLGKIKARAEAMAKANITTAMFFGCHFRWDYLPYFTILHDYLAAVSEELQKCGLELWDHHSVNLIHRYDTTEEMRHVMLHSGPHIPFSPSREAAASWQYKGKYLNDWRMIDVKTRDVLYYPQYAAEGFCYRNPDFVESYLDYAKRLIKDTGITGLSADDPVHYMRFNSCACPHCRAALKERTGVELPPIEDRSFWQNWENPAWRAWVDLRFEASGEFLGKLSGVLPEGFRLTTCGSNSADPEANAKGADARTFLEGCNFVNLEMRGNTPPYKHDPVTDNRPVSTCMVSSSHHQAAARERGYRCFATGFGFTEETANIVWAVNKMLDSDCWFSTLKTRLGLPDHILDSLPNEWDVVGKAFGFEKEHPELFTGKQVAQLGVFFSYETRKHTFFGGVHHGYYLDWRKTIEQLFEVGISPHTVFDFPKDTSEYPLILIPSPLAMTEQEKEHLNTYLENGGIALVYGPSALEGCDDGVIYPSSPVVEDPANAFSGVPNGTRITLPDWMTKTEFPATALEPAWKEVRQGLFYNPGRISEGKIIQTLLSLIKEHMKPMPIEILDSKGYLTTVFEDKDAFVVRMLAADFDTDIDHKLDEMRFHRSRVNYINYVMPTGVTQEIKLKTNHTPEVFTPFNAPATVETKDGVSRVMLPEKTSFLLLRIAKQ